jgi:hypothetical protein
VGRTKAVAVAGGAVALLVLILLIVFVLPGDLAHGTFQGDAQRLKAENDVRTTLLQALAGAFILAGLYFTARTLQLNRSGQITERFTRAIDQLGNETSIEVRLGGIYALERIAKDSSDDRETIYDVLAAFVRQHSPREYPAQIVVDGELVDAESDSDTAFALPTEQIQAALTVLGRRSSRRTDRGIDLSETNLRGLNLQDVDLSGVTLDQADLSRANLSRANLAGAWLEGADLTSAVFHDAHLAGAHLDGANLKAATFDQVDFENIDLGGPILIGAYLAGAKNLDLRSYILELHWAEDQIRMCEWLLRSHSPEELANFSLAPEDLAQFEATEPEPEDEESCGAAS